jgi:hypothetical protein
VKLPHFTLHSTSRFNACFPTPWESPGHRLFVSVFMFASKVIYNGMYSNKPWSLIAQGIFQLRENQLDGARDVRGPQVGAERRFHHPQRVRGHNPQGLQPHPHPAIDEEVDAATHCPPPAAAQSFAVVWSVLSIATQIDPPQNPLMAHMPPLPTTPQIICLHLPIPRHHQCCQCLHPPHPASRTQDIEMVLAQYKVKFECLFVMHY